MEADQVIDPFSSQPQQASSRPVSLKPVSTKQVSKPNLSLEQPFQQAHALIKIACNLLSDPHASCSQPLSSHRLTQLLLGEAVSIVDSQGEWTQVRALHQPCWSADQNAFMGYLGWVPTHCLESLNYMPNCLVTSHEALIRTEPSFEAPVHALSPGASALAAPALAAPALGSLLHCVDSEGGWHRVRWGLQIGWIYDKEIAPWDWMCDQPESVWRWQWQQSFLRYRFASYTLGGMGIELEPRGVDCSGLVHLTARRLGLLIPRDARDQYRLAGQLGLTFRTPYEAKAGDLLFLSRAGPLSIDHVMQQLAEDEWIESTRDHEGFWQSTTQERLGEFQKLEEADQLLFDCEYRVSAMNKNALFSRCFCGLEEELEE